MNKTDLLAKLLASENIDIVRAGVSTASFDIVNRVLTLPQWQDMTDTIEIMLKAHEVGHALFSPIELLVNDSKTPKSYINVVEDVRIERKIKTIFPGLRKDFVQGYKELNERDFFKIANQDLSKLNLINRINLYFKAGSTCGVTFSKQEMVFVERAKTCDTVNDVTVLADDIYTFSKADYEDKKSKQEEQQMSQDPDDSYEEEESYDDFEQDDDNESDDDGDGESDDGDGESDDDGESEQDGPTESDEDRELKEEEKALEASTQQAFDDNLGELADTDLSIINHTTEISSEIKNVIVTYKQVFADLKEDFGISGMGNSYASDYMNKQIVEFKSESVKYVNYLVKEFEMKKSARRYSRTTIAKTGGLNVNKLYAHTISDNLFKSISTVTDDKNHGMIFLLDWSGSMTTVMEDTLKQVINLASFCQRSGIAYQVLAFSSTCHKHRIQANKINNSIITDEFNLLELFSNKMSTSEFNRMINLMLSRPWNYSPNYRLGNTPLNSSLLYMVDYIGKFTITNNVEKTSLVVLTDGVSNSLYVDNSKNDWKKKTLNKIRDIKTKKDYVFPDAADEQTQLLLKIIKDRYNIPVIGFYISGISKNQIYNFIYEFMNKHRKYDYNDMFITYEKIRSSIKKTGVYTLETTAYDELYFLPSSNNKTNTAELEIKPNSTASGMASQFKKFLNNKKTNRTVLDKFIKLVA